MPVSKRSREGWLYVDDRASGGQLGEYPTFTCNHCQAVVVMNPQRTRERGYCRGCDSYICDACEAVRVQTRRCVTFDQIADQVLAAAEQQTGAASPILLP